ncbi:RbsD/FucU domain-containing protein [Erwinia rhapontici]|uniref:RbsD/FucU domain-containing protein n=1 Tax=Erwinia rhapontici TaxID=55212 RepID=UPI003B9E78C5
MIKSEIIHPQLISSLAKCGHKTQILIADANYAFVSNAPKGAEIIYFNLAPGTIASPIILEKLLQVINIEQAAMMSWPTSFENTIVAEYQARLPASCPLTYLDREAFYGEAKSEMTLLVIASGETRRFANLLLTVAPVIHY